MDDFYEGSGHRTVKDINPYEVFESISAVWFKRNQMNAELFVAINYGTLSQVKHLIEHAGADINAVNDEDVDIHGTPLYYAVRRADIPIVRYLTGKSKCNVDLADLNGYTPLLVACESNFVKICKILIAKGADINAGPFLSGNHQYTPLLAACLGGHEELCKVLLRERARVSIKTLISISGLKWSELTMSVIEKNSECKNEALVEASRLRQETLCRTFIEKGAKVNSVVDEETALSAASCEGHVELCRFLIEKGANVNLSCYSGCTPLMLACKGGHEALCKLLIEEGANVLVKDDYDETPLMSAISLGNEAIVKMLLERDTSAIGLQNWRGETALIQACQFGHKNICELLIENGANLHVRGRDQRTPLMAAASYGSDSGDEIIKMLLAKEPVFIEETGSNGETALTACSFGHENAVRCLIEVGANVDAIDDKGNTPLTNAACAGNPVSSEVIIKLLLESGVTSLNHKNHYGMTALDYLFLKYTEGRENSYNSETVFSLALSFLRAGAVLHSDDFRWLVGFNSSILPFCPIILELRRKSSFNLRMISEQVLSYTREPELPRNIHVVSRQFPRSLQASCRTTILQHLPLGLKARQQAIACLYLPLSLENYLNFSDLVLTI